MKSDLKKHSNTEVTLTISGTAEDLLEIKQLTLKRLQPEVSAPGFRKGKVPLNLVEKQVSDAYFKSQFIDDVLTELYSRAANEHNLRPVDRPKVEIKKFVPYEHAEFTVTVEVLPEIKLADYTKTNKQPAKVDVPKKEIDEVIDNLRLRLAEKKTVKRAAKKDDEVWIDFAGNDSKGEPVAGAKGEDYPLRLGSKTFIKGFEENLVGTKAGDTKTFTVTFPKDYGHKPLANKKVTFTVDVKDVKAVELPKVDDKFAAKVGPFKTVEELRKDVERELRQQREQEAHAKFQDEIVEEVVTKSQVETPATLVDDQLEHLLADFKQNLVYRGITFPEYLEQASLSEEDFREKELKPQAERRVKTGLVLAEVAQKEGIQVTEDEVAIRIELMKNQYKDPQAQAALESDATKQDIASRLLTEKTVGRLVEHALKQ